MIYGGDGLVLDVQTLPFTAVAGGQLGYPRDCFLSGVTYEESTGAAAAAVTLFDGLDANGQILDRVAINAGAFNRSNPGQPGMPCERGIFIDVTAGVMNISLTVNRWVKP